MKSIILNCFYWLAIKSLNSRFERNELTKWHHLNWSVSTQSISLIDWVNTEHHYQRGLTHKQSSSPKRHSNQWGIITKKTRCQRGIIIEEASSPKRYHHRQRGHHHQRGIITKEPSSPKGHHHQRGIIVNEAASTKPSESQSWKPF